MLPMEFNHQKADSILFKWKQTAICFSLEFELLEGECSFTSITFMLEYMYKIKRYVSLATKAIKPGHLIVVIRENKIVRLIKRMTNKSIYNRYSPSLAPETINDEPAWFFVFNRDKLLVKAADDTLSVPVKTTVDELKVRILTKYYLGKLDGCDCYCVETDETENLPEGTFFKRLFSLLDRIDTEMFALAGRAYQILTWDKKNRFCGSCGSPTEMKQDERAKVCPKCGNVIYPKISPAVIVGVIKENEILLAHARNFKENWYSIIAGFVEPGETFEDCVKREVFEEVGIKVKNPKYFGSQPWPFPDSLMVGFTAEYESGEIIVDGTEITAAGWYTSDNMPSIPTSASIAGQIINWFRRNQGDLPS